MNDEMTLVSVIVPVYKVENYLRKCIDSILNQTYRNIEVILVDDGSPDHCGAICDEYKQMDFRIKVIHKANGGLSDARNAGIDIAEGEYIVFVDADDWIHKEMIYILYHYIKQFSADISMCMFRCVSEGEVITESLVKCMQEDIEILNSTESLKRYYSSGRIPYVVAWNKMYKASLFKQIRYPKGKIHEDEFTTYKLLYQASKIVVINDDLYYYLQRSGSITGGDLKLKHWDIWQAYEESKKYYARKNNREFYKTVQAKEAYEIIHMYAQLYLMENGTSVNKKKVILKTRFNKIFPCIIKSGKLSIRQELESIFFRITPDGYSFMKSVFHCKLHHT